MKRLIPILLIAAAVALGYLSSFKGTFVFDDHVSIVNNPRIAAPLTAVSGTSRPLTDLTFCMNYRFSGLNTGPYHAVNLIIHILSAVLLFLIISEAGRLISQVDHTIFALLAAVLWGAHPINTESVTYIVQRSESLQAMFILAGIYSLHLAEHNRRFLALSAACAVCSAFSKPVGLISPLIILLYDSFILKHGIRDALSSRRMFYISMAVLMLLPAGLLLMPNESTTSSGIGAGMASPLVYFLTQQKVILHYIGLTMYPVRLCLDYDWPAVSNAFGSIPFALVNISMLILGFVLHRRHSITGLLMILFCLLTAPSSSLFPIADNCAEHRMYLPSAVLIIILMLLVREALRSGFRAEQRADRVFVVLTLIAFTLLSIRTSIRNHDYTSEFRMWNSVAQNAPGNVRAQLGIGTALMYGNRTDEARSAFNKVLQLIKDKDNAMATGKYTEYASAFNNLGVMEYNSRNYSEACQYFLLALDVCPRFTEAERNLATAMQVKGQSDKAYCH